MTETRLRDVGNAVASCRRVLIYSHDTFGLGHLRRSRTIANALMAGDPNMQVVIVTGSSVVDRFVFSPGVSAVRVPPVTKRVDDTYSSVEVGVSLEHTVAARARIIAATAETLRPDLFLVDKEPTGFHGEILPTLERVSAHGSKIVLGLRDVLDDAERLVPEWERKGASAAVRSFYDEIWVYGTPLIHEPMAALPIAHEVADRLIYTGYLRREMPTPQLGRSEPPITREPFILVTPGGGGDGDSLIDWVISAYESDPCIPLPALIAFGPFMHPHQRVAFLGRICKLQGKLSAITFDTEIEILMEKAAGVVAMGGYNTFCEILSFDKRAILVPRTKPRREQLIRALAAERLGLARAVLEKDGRSPAQMATALRLLPDQPRPSQLVVAGLLDGLDVVGTRARTLTSRSHLHVGSGPLLWASG